MAGKHGANQARLRVLALILCIGLFLSACVRTELAVTTQPTQSTPLETTAEPTEPMRENLFSLWLGKDTMAAQNANRYIYNAVADTEDKNLRLSVDSLYSDRHCCSFIYSVELLDGSSAEGLLPVESLTVTGQEESEQLRIQTERLGVDPDDSSRSYYLGTIRSERDLEGFTLELTGLRTAGAEVNTVDCALSVAVSIRPSRTLSVTLSYSTIYNVELSPMSLWIDFVEVPSYVDYNGTPRHDVYIKYKDGSEKGVKVHDFATHTQTKIGWENAEQFVNRSGNATISITFSDFIRLDDVQSIIIDTTEIPLVKG